MDEFNEDQDAVLYFFCNITSRSRVASPARAPKLESATSPYETTNGKFKENFTSPAETTNGKLQEIKETTHPTLSFLKSHPASKARTP